MAEGPTGPTGTRGYKKRARTRDQLLQAAVEVIAERGEAFAVSDVTDRAGVANGTFYNYFPDRDALVAAIVPGILVQLAADAAVAVEAEDAAVRFATITALVLRRARTEPAQTEVLLRLSAAQQELLHGAPVVFLRDDLAAGTAAGRFAVEPTDAVLDVLVGAMLAAARRLLDGRGDDAYAAEVIATLLRSLGIEGPEAASIAADAVRDAWRAITR